MVIMRQTDHMYKWVILKDWHMSGTMDKKSQLWLTEYDNVIGYVGGVNRSVMWTYIIHEFGGYGNC